MLTSAEERGKDGLHTTLLFHLFLSFLLEPQLLLMNLFFLAILLSRGRRKGASVLHTHSRLDRYVVNACISISDRKLCMG